MPGYPGGIWCGSQGTLPYIQVLREALYVGVGGRVLLINLLRVDIRDAGGTAVAQHLQCGGGPSGPPLGITDGGRGLG